MKEEYDCERIARVMREYAQKKGYEPRTFRVRMLYVKEIGEFIKKVESAQKSAANSKLRFKGKKLISVLAN